MWIVMSDGQIVNTDKYRCLGFHGNHVMLMDGDRPEQDVILYTGEKHEEADDFMVWLSESVRDGRRLVHVTDYRRCRSRATRGEVIVSFTVNTKEKPCSSS